MVGALVPKISEGFQKIPHQMQKRRLNTQMHFCQEYVITLAEMIERQVCLGVLILGVVSCNEFFE
jgi:hypothetical protein